MSFFNKMFGNTVSGSEPKAHAKFYVLDSIEELNTIDEVSNQKTVVIFKHSTSCSISRFAFKQFDTNFNFPEDKIDWYMLDLLQHRDVSNEIASRYSVQHQSPQILVIKSHKCIYNASHENIDASELVAFL